jgi:7-cyano-7-deazaguanine synthase
MFKIQIEVVDMKKAIVLLSGGLDSATCLAIADNQGFSVVALSFDYGQKHNIELEKAKGLAVKYGAKHYIFKLPLNLIGGSALTDISLEVPNNNVENIGKEIPITYVPARNTIFLAIAAGFAEVNGVTDIFIGTNAVDYSGYPDCRPQFISAMENAITLGTSYVDKGQKFTIHTPLSNLTKGEIIKLGVSLGVDYSLTTTCYNVDAFGNPCGKCDACKLRLQGFKDAGLQDPLNYGRSE